MEFLNIPVSPKVAEALKKSKNAVSLIQDLNAKLLEALSDNRITFEEVLSLVATIVNIGRQLLKK
jgi:hypothetical protein